MAAVAQRPPEPSLDEAPAPNRLGNALALLFVLGACAEERPAAQRVEQFCSGIQQGEPIDAVRGRYVQFDLQPGGRPPDIAAKVSGLVPADQMLTVSAVLAEPVGSPDGARAVCAIYYSDAEKGGTDNVILAEFKPDWVGRY